jgi:spermidine/putrescine transport system substrate-binding protein
MIENLDHSKIPNVKYLDPSFNKVVAIDKTQAYSLPYMTGTTGLAINKDKVTKYEASWTIYERADLKGRMMLLDDYREVLGAALKYLGYSLNTTDPKQIAQAGDLVKKWKKNIAKFGSDDYKPGMASGEFFVAQGFSGDVKQLKADHDNIVFVLPKEGFSFWSDDMVILKDAPNKELAYEFVNYLTDPEVAAKNMEANDYMSPNTEAKKLVPQAMRDDPMVFVPDEVMAKGEQIVPLGKDDQTYMDVWNKIKSEE